MQISPSQSQSQHEEKGIGHCPYFGTNRQPVPAVRPRSQSGHGTQERVLVFPPASDGCTCYMQLLAHGRGILGENSIALQEQCLRFSNKNLFLLLELPSAGFQRLNLQLQPRWESDKVQLIGLVDVDAAYKSNY